MRERAAGNRATLLGRADRKRLGEVALRDAPVRPVERVKGQAEHASAAADERAWHHADGRDQRSDDDVFELVSHARGLGFKVQGSRFRVLGSRMRSSSQSRNRSAGSTVAVNGTDAIGRSPRSHSARRTASLSVVNTIAAAVDFAAAVIRRMSRAPNR